MTDLVHLNQFFSFVDKLPVVSLYSEMRERSQRVSLGTVEFFKPHEGVRSLFEREREKESLRTEKSPHSLPFSEETLPSITFSSSDDLVASGPSARGRGAGSEKSESRMKWLLLLQSLERLRGKEDYIYPFGNFFVIRFSFILLHRSTISGVSLTGDRGYGERREHRGELHRRSLFLCRLLFSAA